MAENLEAATIQLSQSQQEALDQYIQVTNQEAKDAIPLLQRSQWNVQIAIAKFFDGEAPDLVAEAIAAQENTPRVAARHENLQESLFASSANSFARSQRQDRPDPAPRIVPQPPVTHQLPFLLTIISAPFNLGYRLASTFLRTFVYMLSFLPQRIRPQVITTSVTRGFRGTSGRKMLMPRDTAARFKREFEEEYSSSSLPFFEGGFAQALDAAKKDLKFLLMVLTSPEHDDTESFIRETLLSPETVDFVNDSANNILLWGGNVLDSEAYQVATEYNCTKFPFSAVICLTPKEGSTRMSVVKRLVGPMTPTSYVSELRSAVSKHAGELAGARAERAAQDFARNIRTEQDSAYERSLAQDREKARQRKEAQAAAEAAAKKAEEDERAATRLEEQRRQWKAWRSASIPSEPEPTSKDVVRLALKMPEASGAGRIIRKFGSSTTVEELYAFVECYDLIREGAVLEGTAKPEDYEHEYQFQIASIMPREIYDPTQSATLGEKIGRSGNLIVESLLPESDDEDGEQ